MKNLFTPLDNFRRMFIQRHKNQNPTGFTTVTTTIKTILTLTALSMIAGGFFILKSFDKPFEEGDMPNPDRPDLALKQEIKITKDPATGTVPRERLAAAWAMVQQQKAQKNTNPIPLTTANWTERGPNNVGGRTRAIMFDPNDGTKKKVWAGGVGGGLHYTNDITVASPTWVNVDDFWANLAVSCIAYDPSNTNIFYVGTGEGWYNVDAIRGAGIWKTTDGGATWAQLASTNNSTFYNVQKIVVESTGVLYAATRAGGVRRSTDNGATWTQVLAGAAADLEISANGTLFATIGIFTTGGIYKSTDGTTWSSSYASAAGEQRIEIACAPSDLNTLYAMVQQSDYTLKKIMKSTNAGGSWSSVTLPTWCDQGSSSTDMTRGQAWYDLILAVDPNSASTVFAGGVDVMKSTNSGTAWTQATRWSSFGGCAGVTIHADQHAIVFQPASSSTILFGNDGGIYYTSDGGTTIANRNSGYNVTQFYACAMNGTSGSNYFLAGAQDNGTQKFTTAGMNSTTQATGGDGAYCHIDQTNSTYQLTAYVYNYVYRSTNGGTSFSAINTDQVNGDFINPSDYDDANGILYSSYSTSQLNRITGIRGTPSAPTQISITGMTDYAGTILSSPYAPGGTTTLFIGTQNGKLFKATNAQATPTVTNITGASFSAAGTISCVALGASESDILVTFSNFGVVSVWRTTNGGTTWANAEGNLPDMPIRWAIYNPNNLSEVLLATEVGVWSTTDVTVGSPVWAANVTGLANVRVDMFQYRSSDNMLIAATHGRGLFSSDVFVPAGGAPVADFTGSPTTLCAGSNATFTDASTNTPTSWSWVFQGGSPATSTSQNPVVTYSAAGTYSASLTATNGIGSDTKNRLAYITVNANPTASITVTPSATICSGSNITLTASGGSTYSWAPGGQTTVTKTVAGLTTTTTYTLTATNASGCTNTTTKTITVNALPTPSISATPSATVCTGTIVTLTASGGTTYSWAPGGQTTTTKTIVVTSTATYTVTATNANGCTNTATKTITLAAPPTPSISATPSSTICNGSSVTLTASGGTTYSWAPGGQTTITKIVVVTATATYTVTATNASGCTNTATKTITMAPLPTPSISVTPSATICNGSSVTLTASGATTYSWSGGGQTTASVTKSPTTTSTYTVTGTNASGCTNTATKTITVNSLSVSMSKTDETCATNDGSATATPTGASPYTYSWTPGGGATQTISNLVSGNYTCTVTDNNGCVKTGTVTVGNTCSGPVADFSGSPTTVCSGSTVSFTDLSTGAPTSWSWIFENGSPSSSALQNPTVTYNSAGTYSVSLTATNLSGSNTMDKTAYITVLASPSVVMSKTDATCTSTNGTATATPSGGTSPYTYSWNTGGTTQTISNLAAASYSCTVTDNKGCTGTGTVTVGATACGPTKLQPAYCGITITSLSQPLYCIAVSSATNYQYRVTEPSSGFSYIYTKGTGNNAFAMISVPGIQYAKTYKVEVRVYVSAVWSNWGQICTITTPATTPLTKLQTPYCPITITSLSQPLFCVAVSGATNYQYRVTEPSSGFSYIYTKGTGNNAFAMISVPGILYGKTYNVEVRAYSNTVWGGYGVICAVTTPAGPASQDPLLRSFQPNAEKDYTLTLHPNPVSESSVYFTVEGAVQDEEVLIEIYNLMGTKIYSEKVNYSLGDGVEIRLDEKFVKGVYFVNAIIDEKKLYQKFVMTR